MVYRDQCLLFPHGITNEGQTYTDNFLPGMLIACGGDGLVMCAYILLVKLFISLKVELQAFSKLL